MSIPQSNTIDYLGITFYASPNVVGSAFNELNFGISGAAYTIEFIDGSTSVTGIDTSDGTDFLYLRSINDLGSTATDRFITTNSLGDGALTFNIAKGSSRVEYILYYSPSLLTYENDDHTEGVTLGVSFSPQDNGLLSVNGQVIQPQDKTSSTINLSGIKYDGLDVPDGLSAGIVVYQQSLYTISGITSGDRTTIEGITLGTITSFSNNSANNIISGYTLSWDTSLDDLYMIYYQGLSGFTGASYNFLSVQPFNLPLNNSPTIFRSDSNGVTANIYNINYNFGGVTSGQILVTDQQAGTTSIRNIIKNPNFDFYYAPYFFNSIGGTAIVEPGSYYQYVNPLNNSLFSGETFSIPSHVPLSNDQGITGQLIVSQYNRRQKIVLDLSQFDYFDKDKNSLFNSIDISNSGFNITASNNFIFFDGFNSSKAVLRLPVTITPGIYTPVQIQDYLNTAINSSSLLYKPIVSWNNTANIFSVSVPAIETQYTTRIYSYNHTTTSRPTEQQYLTQPSLSRTMGFSYIQVGSVPPPAPVSTLTTHAVVTFLINGPNAWRTNQYVNWYINSDDSPKYGDLFLTSQPGQPASAAGTMAFSTSGANASPASGNYLKARQAQGTKIQLSLGGYYYDLLGSIYTVQLANDFMQTVAHVLLGLGDPSWNKLNWNASGLVDSSGQRFYFDGLNFDLENVGQGGNPDREGPGGVGILPAVPLPAVPAVTDGPYPLVYDNMIDVCQVLCTAWGGLTGTSNKIFSIAPLNPATTWLTKNTAPTTALGNYQAFAGPTAGLSTYSAGNAKGAKAQIHPNQLKYFNQVFTQIYNEPNEWLPGGAYFNQNIAQWAFLVKKAQDLGGKTKLMLGFATQDIAIGAPWSDVTDPGLVNTALGYANEQLKPYYPMVQISDWCDGLGFWASPSGTTALANVYGYAPARIPNLPTTGNCMVWADADYNLSKLDPLWDTALPVATPPARTTLPPTGAVGISGGLASTSSSSKGQIYLVSQNSGNTATVYSGLTGIPFNGSSASITYAGPSYIVEFPDLGPTGATTIPYNLSFYDNSIQSLRTSNITIPVQFSGLNSTNESLNAVEEEKVISTSNLYLKFNQFDYLDDYTSSIFGPGGVTGGLISLLDGTTSGPLLGSTAYDYSLGSTYNYIISATGTFSSTQLKQTYLRFAPNGTTSYNTAYKSIIFDPNESFIGTFTNYQETSTSLNFSLTNFDYLDSSGLSIFNDPWYASNPHIGSIELCNPSGIVLQSIPFTTLPTNQVFSFSINAQGPFNTYFLRFNDSTINSIRTSIKYIIQMSTGITSYPDGNADGGVAFGYTGPAALQFPYVFNANAAEVTEVIVLGELTKPLDFDQKIVLNVPREELQRMLVYDSAWSGGQYGTGASGGGGFSGLSGTTHQTASGFTGPNIGLFLKYVLSQVNVSLPDGFTGHNGVSGQSDRLGGLDILLSGPTSINYQTEGNSGQTGNPWGVIGGSSGYFLDDAGISGPAIIQYMADNNISGIGATFSPNSLLNFIPAEAIRSIKQLGFRIDKVSDVVADVDTTMPTYTDPLRNLFEQSVAYQRVTDSVSYPLSIVPTGLTGPGNPWSTAAKIYGVDFNNGDSLTFYIRYAMGAVRRYGIDPTVVAGLDPIWQNAPSIKLTFNGKSFDIPIGSSSPYSGLTGGGTTGGSDSDTELSSGGQIRTLAIELLASPNKSNFDY